MEQDGANEDLLRDLQEDVDAGLEPGWLLDVFARTHHHHENASSSTQHLIRSDTANARQLEKLGRALLHSPLDQSIHLELKDGAFCQIGATQVSAVADLSRFLRTTTFVEMLSLGATSREDLDYRIPCHLLVAFARGTRQKKQVSLSGFNLACLSTGIIALMQSPSPVTVLLSGSMQEIDDSNAALIQQMLSTQKGGLKGLIIQLGAPLKLVGTCFLGVAGQDTFESILVRELDGASVPQLCRVLDNCPNFKQFQHRGHLSASVIEAMAVNLTGTSTTCELGFAAPGLGHDHMVALSKVISKLPQLSELRLECDNLEHKGFSFLCKSLQGNETIEKLILEHNTTAHFSIGKDLAALFAKNRTLKILDIDLNQVSGCNKEIWDAFLQSKTPDLTITLFAGTEGSADQWVQMYRVLIQHDWVMNLSWKKTWMGAAVLLNMSKEVGNRVMRRSVRTNYRLSEEQLCNCLSELLQLKYPGLHSLEISSNLFESENWTTVLEFALKQSPYLRNLCIPAGRWSEEPALVPLLCQLLPEAEKLESLELFVGRHLKKGWVDSLRRAFDANRSLTWIELSGTIAYRQRIPTDFYALRNRMSTLTEEDIPFLDKVVTQDVPTHAPSSTGWAPRYRRLHAGFWAAKLFSCQSHVAGKRKLGTW